MVRIPGRGRGAIMPRVGLQTPDPTTGRAHDLLADLWERHDGAVGPMVRAMAGSPAVLSGYLELSRAMKRSKLPRAVTERISLAVLRANGWRDRDVLDVVGLVALNVLTGSFNLVAGIEPAA